LWHCCPSLTQKAKKILDFGFWILDKDPKSNVSTINRLLSVQNLKFD
jgi:hypothetical protein